MTASKWLSEGRLRRLGDQQVVYALTVLCLLVSASSSICEPRSDKDASTVVSQWLRLDSAPMNTRLGGKVAKVVPLRDSTGTVFAYSVHLKPAGFVIVPAEDEVEPFIAFSPGTDFKLSEDNPLGAMILHDAAGRVNMARREQKAVAPGKENKLSPQAASAKSKWNLFRERLPLFDTPALMDGAIILTGEGSISDVRVAPFVLSKWGQQDAAGGNCYDYYTPNNDPCGCVATAMAQWMRYFQRPTFGVGTTSFSITVRGTPESHPLMGGNGSGGPYSWADMPLDPAAGVTEVQRKAIGALCHDAGVAAHMAYAASASGTSADEALIAMTNTFGYSNGIFGGYQDARDLSGADFNLMANPNLHAKMPVLLGILKNGGGGHAVLCDGYGYNSGTIYHHLNMGWSGSQDAWYNLPNINSSPSYDCVFACLYNVYTSGVGEIVSGRVTNSLGGPITGVVVTAQNESGAVFTGTSDSTGIYAVINMPSSTRYWVSASRSGYSFTGQTADTGHSLDYAPPSGNVWGKDFLGAVATGPADPMALAAWTGNNSGIDLRWIRNTSNDSVMIAWKTNGTFGTPSGTYSPGDPISGGGTVLYCGSTTNFSHTNLKPATTYDYRAWSVDANTNYSAGTAVSAVSGPAEPRSLSALARSSSVIDLLWTRNNYDDNVMIAWKTNGTFGTPSGTYSPGDPISGGGTVLYSGSATNFAHTNLPSGTTYDYRAWSVDAATNYSAGTPVSATTFYIFYVNDSSTVGDVWCSTTGNDSNSGTLSNAPKATVQAILDTYNLEPGDSVHVDTGTYVLPANIVVGAADQGSPQHHVTIRGSPNGIVIDRNCGTNGAYGLLLDCADYMDLLDLSFTSGYHSVYMYDADVCVVSNLTVRGATNHGVNLSYSWYNQFDDFRICGCGVEGIYAYYSRYNKFTHGTVWNNKDDGVDLFYSISNLFENCTVAFNTFYQFYTYGAQTVLLLTNSIVTVSGSDHYCIYMDSGSYIGDYNDLFATNSANVGYYGGTRTTLANWRTATSRDTNSISADPVFINATTGDFHLQSRAGSYHGGAWTADATNSPAIDTGLPASSHALEPPPNGDFVNMGAHGNTAQASKSADTDEDGVSDSFETVRMGTDPAVADSDADGLNDGDERAAGTDPTNASSVFAITRVAQPEPARTAVQWYSVTNYMYAIDRATNLMVGGFLSLTNNILATPPINVYTDVVEGLGNTLFYRIKTQP